MRTIPTVLVHSQRKRCTPGSKLPTLALWVKKSRFGLWAANGQAGMIYLDDCAPRDPLLLISLLGSRRLDVIYLSVHCSYNA